MACEKDAITFIGADRFLLILTAWLSPRFTCRMRRSLRMSLRCRIGVPALKCFCQGSSKNEDLLKPTDTEIIGLAVLINCLENLTRIVFQRQS